MSETKTREEKPIIRRFVITIPTQKAIAEFFLITSIPRILKKIRESK